MKKIFLLLAAVGMIFTACTPGGGLDDDNNDNNTEQPGGGNDDAIPTDKIVIKPSTITVEAAANNYIVAVSSPCSWRATTEEDWITLETELGIDGKQQLIFAVKDYWETEPREGKIVVSNSEEGFSVELTVVQKAFVPIFEIEDIQTLEYDHKGQSKTISVIANFDYDVTTTADWVTCEKNDIGVDVSLSLLEDKDNRSAEVKIFSEKYNMEGRIITITQMPTPYPIGSLVTIEGAKGIVFYFDATVTKIVSVEEAIFEWSTESVATGAYDWYNGANNMAIIKSISGWENKYPAFKWCADYGEGWYLPARNEAHTMGEQSAIINTTLEANGYDNKIDGWGWSSTEYSSDAAHKIQIDWYPFQENKQSKLFVRAVLAFEN